MGGMLGSIPPGKTPEEEEEAGAGAVLDDILSLPCGLLVLLVSSSDEGVSMIALKYQLNDRCVEYKSDLFGLVWIPK